MPTPAPDWDAEAIIAHLQTHASARNAAGMARYGIETSAALGIPNAILRPMAKNLKRSHPRAAKLWSSGIREARLLAIFTEEPELVTPAQARSWVAELNSWELVDHAAALFVETGHVNELIVEFSSDNREFVRRTAFAMIAWAAVHLKTTPDEQILAWLPLIELRASDDRNFVKKAVNWALRQIGKRSVTCHSRALSLASKLAESEDKTERWVGRGAVTELASQKTLHRLGLTSTS